MKFGNEEEIGKTMSPAKTWFDRSTQLTALRFSKGNLTTLTHSTLLRVILREIEG